MTASYYLPVTGVPNVFPGGSIGEFDEWRAARGFLGKAGCCQYCGVNFAPDETVIMVRDWWLYGDWASVCAGCADPEELAASKRRDTCRGCGQPMLIPRRQSRLNPRTGECRAIRSQVCGKRCEQRYRRQLQRESRKEVHCTVCALPFVPKRSDAKFCSGACRQWTYRRQRQGTSRGGRAALWGLRPGDIPYVPSARLLYNKC